MKRGLSSARIAAYSATGSAYWARSGSWPGKAAPISSRAKAAKARVVGVGEYR
jgi:hypothetical protein